MGVLSSDVLLSETFPLDDNYKEIPERTEDMMNFLCFMKNTYKDSSQCQGATWLGDGIIAVCDIDSYQTKPEQGVIRIFRINPDDPYDIEEICEIKDVMGHSNDITYLPDEGVILHPNHGTKEMDVIYLNDDFEEEEREVISNREADGIAYDEENDRIVTIDSMELNVYSKDDFFNGKEPKSKTMIPDAINDEENGIYYNQRGGAVARDGKIYVGYTGYEKDKRSYNIYDKSDTHVPQSNMIVIYDCETGKCEGRITNNSNGEVESVTFDDDGNPVWILNCENDTYVVQSDMSKAKK